MGDMRGEPPLQQASAPSVAIQLPPLPQERAAFRFRWRGTAAARCLEVVHARTGTRFVLSRDGYAWLLAVEGEHRPDSAELATVLATLNEMFTARGLGPIDVIAN